MSKKNRETIITKAFDRYDDFKDFLDKTKEFFSFQKKIPELKESNNKGGGISSVGGLKKENGQIMIETQKKIRNSGEKTRTLGGTILGNPNKINFAHGQRINKPLVKNMPKYLLSDNSEEVKDLDLVKENKIQTEVNSFKKTLDNLKKELKQEIKKASDNSLFEKEQILKELRTILEELQDIKDAFSYFGNDEKVKEIENEIEKVKDKIKNLIRS